MRGAADVDSEASDLDRPEEGDQSAHVGGMDQGTALTDMEHDRDMSPPTPPGKGSLYVSGGAWGEQGFITRFEYDSTRGVVTRGEDTFAGNVLTYLAHSPRHNLLYAPDEANPNLYMFTIQGDAGALSMPTTQQTRCHGVHVMLDAAQEHVILSCHREGQAELFHQPDRETINSTDLVSSGARTHQACMSPEEDRLFVVSLQRQRLMRYAIDAGTHKLAALDPAAVQIPGNIGPRHMVMHPTQPRAYILGESQPLIHVATWDEAKKNLVTGQGISLLEDDATRESAGAAIRVHPSGRWLFASQRFLDGRDGRLAVVELDAKGDPVGAPRYFSTLGIKPRDLNLSPNGALLAVANRTSRSVALFGFDARSGELTYLRAEALPGEPMSVLFVERSP